MNEGVVYPTNSIESGQHISHNQNVLDQNSETQNNYQEESQKWHGKAKKDKTFKVKEMFDLMNKTVKDIHFDTMDEFQDQFEDELKHQGLGHKADRGKFYCENMKQKLRAATNDLIDSLECYFLESFVRKNDLNVEVLEFSNEGVNILPPISLKAEIIKFDKIKKEIGKSVESHVNLKAKFLQRKYEKTYKQNLDEFYSEFMTGKNTDQKQTDDKNPGDQKSIETTKEQESNFLVRMGDKINNNTENLKEFDKIADAVLLTNKQLDMELKNLL